MNFRSVIRPIAMRLLHSVLTLWLVTVLFFAINQLAPYDFAVAGASQGTTQAMIDATRLRLGLNLSPPVQYLHWLSDLLRGDLGISWWAKQPVAPMIAERLWHSAWLFGWAVLVTIPISLGLALSATIWRGSYDRITSLGAIAAISLPDFVVAYGCMIVFAVYFDVFPAHTIYAVDIPLAERIHASALPVMSLAAVTITPMFRLSRAVLLSILANEYIEMAVLKGLRHRDLILRHTLPNAIGPIANAIVLAIANLFFGMVIIEVIYSYPGLGSLLVTAVKLQDMPLAQGCGLVSAVVYISLIFLADSVSVLANPRLRYPVNGRSRRGKS